MRVMFLNYYTLSWNGSPFAQNSRSPLFSVEKNSTVVYDEYVDDTL